MESASASSSQEHKTFIHVLELVKDDVHILQEIATEQLNLNGIQTVSLKRRESRLCSKSRKSGSPGPNGGVGNSANHEIVEANLGFNNVTVLVPKFLKQIVPFLKNHLDTQGLFRLGGSERKITAFTNASSQVQVEMMNSSSASLVDVCCAMKRFILNKDKDNAKDKGEGLIPQNLHHVFFRCLELPPNQIRDALSLAVLLLPKRQLHILFYLMEFLHEFTEHSQKNLMDSENLAKMFAPNIFVVPEKDVGSLATTLDYNTKCRNIVKILIEDGDRLGVASDAVARAVESALHKKSEDEQEGDGESRKTKPRSASLNRILEFLGKKSVTRNAQTPVRGLSPGINTPIIMSHSRKRSSDAAVATPMSTNAKKGLMSILQHNKRTLKAGAIVFPSPDVSLNPRPDVKESAGSILPKARTVRSLYRSNGSRSLPNSEGERDSTRSDLPIVPLANSPRNSLPRQRSQRTITLRSDSSEGISEPTPQKESPNMDLTEALRFTPMLREINELTLAALEESPAPETDFVKTLTGLEILPVAMEVDVPTISEDSNCRSTRSRSKFRREARRCQSLNDARRPRTRKTILRRKSDATGMVLRRKLRSPAAVSPIPVYPKRIAQSLNTLNRSPTRCTLRRGRPNTMKSGLPRPSPHTGSIQSELNIISDDAELTPGDIIMNRKGRVSRRPSKRPSIRSPETKLEKSKEMVVKPPRAFVSKLQSPKKVVMNSIPESPSSTTTHQPLSYVASKLKREEDGTVKMILIGAHGAPMSTTPLVNRKGRSCSMRSDMIRPSPNNKGIPLAYNSMLRKPNNCENGGSKVGAGIQGRPMSRGVSVQELVRKFDSCNDLAPASRPTFSTMRRGTKTERPSLPTAYTTTTRNKMSGTASTVKAIPPAKPPRTSFAENRNNALTGKSSTKQTQFNTNLTRSVSSTSNFSRGSKQVLKTMNLP